MKRTIAINKETLKQLAEARNELEIQLSKAWESLNKAIASGNLSAPVIVSKRKFLNTIEHYLLSSLSLQTQILNSPDELTTSFSQPHSDYYTSKEARHSQNNDIREASRFNSISALKQSQPDLF